MPSPTRRGTVWGWAFSLWGHSLRRGFAIAQIGMGRPVARFLKAFPVVFLLALLAQVLSEHSIIKYYNLEYPLWGWLSDSRST